MGVFSKKEEAPVYTAAPAAPVTETVSDAVKDTFEEEEKKMPEQTVEIAVISASTVIDGNISTDGNLILAGDVKGNVNVKGDLVLDGRTAGEIHCNSLLAEKTETETDIVAYNNVVIKEDTVINGNISCKNITVCGKVFGDIVASGSVILKASAEVKGNITSASLGIESGAKIEGSIISK